MTINQFELVRNNHEMVYYQLIERVKMRDNVILIYLAAIGTTFTVAYNESTNPEMLLIVPYLALGASILFSHHNILIGAILDFFKTEINEFISQNFNNQYVPQYETSKSFLRSFMPALWLITFGSFFLIVIPCIASLAINLKYSNSGDTQLIFTWWVGLISVCVAIMIMIYTHILRARFNKENQQ